MAFDFGLGMVDEGVVAVAEDDRALLWMGLPIATVDPFPPFSGMTKAPPFSQFPEQFLVEIVEDGFSRTTFVVVGPAPDDRIEFADQGGLA